MSDTDIKDIWHYANNIIRTSRQMINERLCSLALSSSEGNILLHLFTCNREVRQEDIVGQLDISKPAVSRAVKSLEKKGYIERSKDTLDRRATRILTTEKARKIKLEIEGIYNEAYLTAARGVSEEEIAFFVTLFGKVSDNFTRARAAKKLRGENNAAK